MKKMLLTRASTFRLKEKQEENILELNDSKLYFAINSSINSKYYINKYSQYSKKLEQYHLRKSEELAEGDPWKLPKIILPDSLTEGKFQIKKGFYAIKVDSINSAPFVINDFELELWGNGRMMVNVKVPDTLNHEMQDLFIIARSNESLKDIVPFNPKVCTDSKTSSIILELIHNFFYTNRDQLKKQLSYEYSVGDSLSIDELEEIISMLYVLSIFEIEGNCYLTIGSSKRYIHPRFFALVFPDEGKVELKINSRLFRSFKINDDYFFYCKSSTPFTGGHTYKIYLFEESKLKPIFYDGAFAM